MFRPIIATQLQQVIELAYKINNTAQLDGTPKTLPAVIINFHGDTGWFDVFIYPEGRYQLPMRHIFKEVNLSKEIAPEQLDEIIKILDLTYTNKKIKEKEYGE